MYSTLGIIVYFIWSFRIVRAIRGEAEVYREIGQKAVTWPVRLFPVAPLVLLLLPVLAGWIVSYVIAYLCFIPALIVYSRQRHALDTSGTSRTDKAKDASDTALWAALLGLAYVTIGVVFSLYMYSFEPTW